MPEPEPAPIVPELPEREAVNAVLSLLTVLVLVLVLVDPEAAGLESDPGPELDPDPEPAAVGELVVGELVVGVLVVALSLVEPDPLLADPGLPGLVTVVPPAVGGVAVDPADPLSGGLRGPLLAPPPARAELAVDLDEGLDDELEDSGPLGSGVVSDGLARVVVASGVVMRASESDQPSAPGAEAATVLLAGVQMVAPSPSVAEVWKSEVRANMEPTLAPMKAAVTSVRRPNAPNRWGEGRGEGGSAAVVNCTRRRPGDSLIGPV